MIDRLVPFTDGQLWHTLASVLPCWLLLAIAPTFKLTQALCILVTFYLCVLYTTVVIPILTAPGAQEKMQAMFTLQGVVQAVKSSPALVLAVWVQKDCLDLWTGRWIALDAAQRRMPRLLVAPCLFLQLMLGPIGLGSYLLLRTRFKAPKSKRD